MNAPKRPGNGSELKNSPLGTSNAGNNSQINHRNGNEILSIPVCRADLLDFLQRTRRRLQAITGNVSDCFENNSDEHDASRGHQGAGSTQALKPLPIPTPMLQRHHEEKNVNASLGEVISQGKVERYRSTSPCGDRSSTSATERFAMQARTQVVTGSGDSVAVPRLDCNEADWSVSNAFDRNTYYGPTDFALMPDNSEGSASRGLRSNEEHTVSGALCSSKPLIEFGGVQASTSWNSMSSPLHLANQIRKN